MRITLIGYGKMGKAIEQIAIERGHQIVQIIEKDQTLAQMQATDCCIEFTNPDAAFDNLKYCVEHQIPVVTGTTGWYQHYQTICDLVNQNKAAFLSATNFSIGVNMLFKLNEQLAAMMDKFGTYQVKMEEIHHLQKLDHPSGTGITLAEQIVNNMDRLEGYHGYLENEIVEANEKILPILCKREPEVPGTHTVMYSSEIDEISISHRAKNRKGFATGAVIAAEWLVDKKGVFGMNDVLGF